MIVPAGTSLWDTREIGTLYELFDYRETLKETLAVSIDQKLQPDYDETLVPYESQDIPVICVEKGIATKELFVIEEATSHSDFAFDGSEWVIGFINDDPTDLRNSLPRIEADIRDMATQYDPSKKEPVHIVALTMWEEVGNADEPRLQYAGLGQTILKP
jgi:hypothetical protein